MTKRDPFIMLPYGIYDSTAFAALEPIHIAILLLLIRKYNGHNNGGITLGVREAGGRCHCSQATACRAFARLQKDGFISVAYKGHLVPEFGRPDAATRWKLNFVKDSAMEPKEGRFPNETSGCFSGETSLGQAVRFPGETSPRASLVKQSIDNLTTAKPKGGGETSPGELPVNRGNDPTVGGRDAPMADQPNPGKPNGEDQHVMTAEHETAAVVPLRRANNAAP
jgi:hypothetical protein